MEHRYDFMIGHFSFALILFKVQYITYDIANVCLPLKKLSSYYGSLIDTKKKLISGTYSKKERKKLREKGKNPFKSHDTSVKVFIFLFPVAARSVQEMRSQQSGT